MKPILSIIVPSYNTSKFVDECLPTFIDEYLIGKVVIYLIDDGATDDTQDKIQKYAMDYPDLFKFVHKENGGHGSVINFGVHNLVKSKYFKIIDGDDYVETSSLIDLVKYLLECNDDIIISGFYRGLPGSMDKYEPFCRNTKIKEKTTFFMKDLMDFNVLLYSCTYKTEIFTKNNIKVREKVFYEDNELRAYPLEFSNTFSYIKCYPYCYRYGVAGQSVSLASAIKHEEDAKLVMNDLMVFYSKIRNNIELRNIIGSIIASNVNFYTEILCAANNKEMILECRKKWSLYKNNKEIKKYVLASSRYKKILILTNFLAAPLFKKRWQQKR